MSRIKFCWNCKNEVPYQEYKNINFIPKCSKCGVQYPEKPKDEAMLSIYQNDYLNDRSDENLNKLFTLMSKVTFNIICHKLKCTSSHEDLDDIWDKVQWTLEKITKYYKEKPDFKISTSFIQYISQVVLYPLYNTDEQEKRKREISIHTPKFNNARDKKELSDYLSSDFDGGINKLEDDVCYDGVKNELIDESIKYISTVITSLYNYEKAQNSGKEFKNSLYMAQLYKYFIGSGSSNKLVEEIMNSMDFKLIKKFNASKEIYKDILIKHSNGD